MLSFRDFRFIAKRPTENSERFTSHEQPVAPMADTLLKHARSGELRCFAGKWVSPSFPHGRVICCRNGKYRASGGGSGFHLVASLPKRWLIGTHQGGIQHQHLDYYLDEITFRFNRRRSRARGLLFHRLAQQAVAVAPAPYHTIVSPENANDSQKSGE